MRDGSVLEGRGTGAGGIPAGPALRLVSMSEIDDIRRKYEAGQLDPIKDDLERFILAHRPHIAAYRAEQEGKGLQLSDEAAIKFYLLRRRSINPQRDIHEQLEEIQREKWIQGVQQGCPPDGQRVAGEWARRYSAGWRAHRVTTIVYVFERDKDRYCRLIR